MTNVSKGVAVVPMSLEAPTPTATPVWESTFDECIERRGGGTYGVGDSNPYCYTSLGSTFEESIERRSGGTYGLGDSNPYC